MSAVQLTEHGPVLVMTLDRPEVLNAVDGTMTRALVAAIDRLERSPALRVGLLTGAGRAFCAGLDMKAVAAGMPIAETRHPRWGFAGLTSRVVRKPLVGALNGDAVGGGLEIALACDLIVAAEHARIGLPEVRRGVFAAGSGVYRLARQLPARIAKDLLLTGRLMPAGEAAGWGLINAVRPADEVFDVALRMARTSALNAPLAVEATKKLADLGLAPTDPQAIELQEAATRRVLGSSDAREGMLAFVEHRPPSFLGR